jgi:hypothetical protein
MASLSIKTKDISINPQSPFDNDLLDREEEIKNLTNIIQNVEAPLVLAVNAPWGTGKTTFINLWRAYLQKEKFQCICFNAWETDYAEDPLIPLVSEFGKWIDKEKGYPTGELNKRIKKLMPKIAKHAALTGVKIATYGLININSEKIKEMLADATGEMAGDLVEQFNEKSKANEKFIKLIEESLKQLPENQNLVIFIDELDRCRPTYAIELLERIKHLFNIKRLVFVLSIDREQLSHSICAVYGNNFDAKKYLNRFIDLDYLLKEPDLKKYIDSNLEMLSIKDYYLKQEGKKQGSYGRLLDLIFFFAIRLKLKLRDINLLISRFELILLSTPKESLYFYPKNSLEYEPILLTLMILRSYNQNLYQSYQLNYEKTEVIKEIIDFLSEEMSESEAVISTSKNMNSNDKVLKYNFALTFVKICIFFIAFSYSPKNVEEDIAKHCMIRVAHYSGSKLSPLDRHAHATNYGGIDFNFIMQEIREIKHNDDSRGFNNVQLIIDHIELFHRININ